MRDNSNHIPRKAMNNTHQAEQTEEAPSKQRRVDRKGFHIYIGEAILRTYGVSIKFYDGQFENDAQAPARRVDYEMEVAIAPHEELRDRYWLSFTKKKLFINRHEPDLVAEELAAKFMEALNPIRVLVDKANKIQGGVANMKEIWANWERVKRAILDKYESELTDRLLEHAERLLENPAQLLLRLEKDMFWKAFFTPVYGVYDNQLQRDMVLNFPINSKRNLTFEAKQQVRTYISDYDTYKIDFQSEETRNGQLKYTYDLEESNGLLKYMVIEHYIDNKKEMQFSAYQCEKDKTDRDGFSVTGIGTKKPKRFGFWGLFD